ncbi:hypothetical protein M222_2782 [Enterococcus faecalis AZ19]|nr:hypothetical protein M222_2782 [Enterococcus faecalis AZ19]
MPACLKVKALLVIGVFLFWVNPVGGVMATPFASTNFSVTLRL